MKTKLVLLVILLAVLMGCSSLEKNTLSGTRLVIQNITGNDVSGSAGSTIIFSDVLFTSGSIVNDNAEVTATAQLLDTLNAAPTFYQDVVVDQVDVKFSRTDGRNVEGKDVPYGFSTPLSAYIKVASDATFGLTIITHDAKMESPLIELRDIVQEKVLALNATLTFYARDMAGKRLEPVTRTVLIYCANFADAK
jgi:hypothetical protein